MTPLRSRENARARHWHALARDARLRGRTGGALLEGVHLLTAYLDAGGRPREVLVSESAAGRPEVAALVRRGGAAPAVLSDALFRWIADVGTPVGVAAEIEIPKVADGVGEARHVVFLDGIQDAGNVGAILRSAAAFGVDTAVLGPGCADAWSPKVLRAAMGGHFALRLSAVADLPGALDQFPGRIVCAVASGGQAPDALDLVPAPLGWILGSEGQGVSAAAAARATLRVSIPMAGGSESLNVAAAAAVLLYERRRQLSRRGARS